MPLFSIFTLFNVFDVVRLLKLLSFAVNYVELLLIWEIVDQNDWNMHQTVNQTASYLAYDLMNYYVNVFFYCSLVIEDAYVAMLIGSQ